VRKPKQDEGEMLHCVVDGKEHYKLMSPVFKQNLYSGVYDDLHPRALPGDLSLFDVNPEKYPQTANVQDYILDVTVEKGDCLYIPALYYFQSETSAKESTIVTLHYEPASKYIKLL
jgi:hypothetical protein